MNIQEVLNQASDFALQGKYGAAAEAYEYVLKELEQQPISRSQLAQVERSVAFNLAQVYNHLGKHELAIRMTDRGLALSPTPVGMAIALTAKGEALYALGRGSEGQQAFDRAVDSNPIIGRLNSADSMTRLDSPEMWSSAEIRVKTVLASFAQELDSNLKAEAQTILGKVAVRRNDASRARECFKQALETCPGFADAVLQLRRLDDK